MLETSLSGYRRELSFHDLTVALAAGDGDARRLARALLLTRGFDRRRRVQLTGMTLAPRLAGRLLRRRATGAWVGAGGIRVVRR